MEYLDLWFVWPGFWGPGIEGRPRLRGFGALGQ
jgi:hypothetical protein